MTTTTSAGDVTLLLRELSAGNREALNQLLPIVYRDLHRRAANFMRHERRDHTFTPTVLVHEAYLRLVKQNRVKWRDRTHFFAIASKMMRRSLIEHARRKRIRKLPFDSQLQLSGSRQDDYIVVAHAIEKLEALDERQAQIVDMKIFGQMPNREIAAELGISESTLLREWRYAKTWLKRELREDKPS